MTDEEKKIVNAYINDDLIPEYSDGWLGYIGLADIALDELDDGDFDDRFFKLTKLGAAIINNQDEFMQMVKKSLEEMEKENVEANVLFKSSRYKR